MPWFRLDDETGDHPKVLQAGNDGFGLWARCGTHCAKYLTDGFVGEAVALSKGPQKLIDKVTAAGLWKRVDGGYLIEDYLEFNPSKEQVLADRAAAAARQQRARDRAAEKRAARNAQSHANRHGVTHDGVTVPPYPNPIDAAAAASPGGGSGDALPGNVRVFADKIHAVPALRALSFDVATDRIDELARLIDLHGDRPLIDAALRTCRTPVPTYVSAFLATWRALPAPGTTLQVVDDPRCDFCGQFQSKHEAAEAKHDPEDRHEFTRSVS